MKKSNPNPKANKNILRLAYVVAGVFVCMILYLGYFLQFKSDSAINNAYNPRVDLLAERVVRGGTPAMGLVTGTGCMLSALTGAFLGGQRPEERDYFEAAAAAASMPFMPPVLGTMTLLTFLMMLLLTPSQTEPGSWPSTSRALAAA